MSNFRPNYISPRLRAKEIVAERGFQYSNTLEDPERNPEQSWQ